jgi:hypothetical protein
MLSKLWVLCLLLMSCVYLNPRGPVSIDSAFTAAERRTIEEAFHRWSEATGQRVRLHVIPTGYPIERHDRERDTYGHTHSFPVGYIQLDPGRVGESGLRTVMHELGHAFLGPGHSDDPKSLMYFENNKVTKVDPETRARFCKKWGCP